MNEQSKGYRRVIRARRKMEEAKAASPASAGSVSVGDWIETTLSDGAKIRARIDNEPSCRHAETLIASGRWRKQNAEGEAPPRQVKHDLPNDHE